MQIAELRYQFGTFAEGLAYESIKLLLPPDLRDWLPQDYMVHFIMDAIKAWDLSSARINTRGTGSAQYPPSMMLGLLIYCYFTGTFSSRRIETLTFENVSVRFLCADTHPDHDSICKFRRENKKLLSSYFHQGLELATNAGRELYGLRKQTVEPVFGIIKEALGFRRFSMRSLSNCNSKWDLVSASYNLKRLFGLGMRFKSS